MNYTEKLLSLVADRNTQKLKDAASDVKYKGLVKAPSATISYARRHRNQWFKPEYDFKTLQIAQHTEAILLRTIKKIKDRIVLAGHEIVGKSEDPVQYVRNRISQMELVTNKPWKLLIAETVEDLARQNNCMWIKVRSSASSSGAIRTDLFSGKEVEPVAGYYQVQFEELEFKTKVSGELKKIRQVSQNSADTREWAPSDVIHFYVDRKPGFVVGTPALLPALDDISLLRRIEENIEELIDTNLFPAYHYKIGNDLMPERRTPITGETESEVIMRKLEYMPAGSVYVSDHRHEIEAIGSQGKALAIEGYLAYFLKRAISSSGATEVDLGMGGDSNRSTANTLSKSMILDIKALQTHMKMFIDFYVIRELLLEGGYDVFDPENHVEIKFGEIDVEERMAIENQTIQTFINNLVSLDEARAVLGLKPVQDNEEWMSGSFYKLFEEASAMAKSAGIAGSAASETLANMPQSNVSPEAVNKAKAFTKQLNATKKATTPRKPGAGRKANSSAGNKSASRARPTNQHKTRSAPKLNKDLIINNTIVTIDLAEIDESRLTDWSLQVEERYNLVKDFGVSIQTVADNMRYRLLKNE